MSDRLITIAKFLQPVEAELMRNRLAEYGIRAMLDNYQTTQAAWYLMQALGGIKLFVREPDVEAALAVLAELETELAAARAAHEQAAAALDEQYALHPVEPIAARHETAEEDEPEDGEDRWWEVEEDDAADSLDEEAKPWQPPVHAQQPVDPPPPPVPPAPANGRSRELADESEEDELPLNGREELVLKAFRVAVLGYYFLPLHLYVPFLVINAWYDPRPLQPDLRKKLRWAIRLNAIFWLLLGMVIFLPFGLEALREISTDWTRSLKTK